jgi:hypothetical protein
MNEPQNLRGPSLPNEPIGLREAGPPSEPIELRGPLTMSDFSRVELVRLELNCLKAASRAHDPDFKRIWLEHAAALRAMYDKKGTH